MSENSKCVDFGPADSEGFRSFSLRNPDGAEFLRLSLSIERVQHYLKKIDQQYLDALSARADWAPSQTDDDAGQFNKNEHKALTLAASLLACRRAAPFKGDKEAARRAVLEIKSAVIEKHFEKDYPFLATRALEAASDMLIKITLNRVLESEGVPRIYDEAFVDNLLRDLKAEFMRGLGVSKGRPAGTYEHMRKTIVALDRLSKYSSTRLEGGRPTPEDVASEVDSDEKGDGKTDERTVRRWANNVGMSWEEWLCACGWNDESDAARN